MTASRFCRLLRDSRQITAIRSIQSVALISVLSLFFGLARADENVDLLVVHRIKAEAFEHSKVMDHLFYLTDVNGPRLTGSPGWDNAAAWTMDRLKQYGLEQVHLEPWGPLAQSWTFTRFEIALTKPTYTPLHGTPKAWCGGTKGTVHGPVIATQLVQEDEELRDLDIATLRERIDEYQLQWKGKLRGKIVLLGRMRDFTQPTESLSQRIDDKGLASLAEGPQPALAPKVDWVPDRLPRDSVKRQAFLNHLPLEMMANYWIRKARAYDPLNLFLRQEGAIAVLQTDKRGAGGLVFAEACSSVTSGAPEPPPTITIAPEQFNRLWRLTEKGIPAEVQLNLAVGVINSPKTANVLAEIPGDSKKNEIVMMGAHLDSWHAGTGATDNGAGCAVVIEAARILKTLGLKMDRTVRIALWSGEEQALYGSRAYVRDHFGDPLRMVLKPEHARLSGYFNLDNGSGKIRGIHLQGNDMVRPVFESWFAPFKDLSAGTVTIRNTGGTDHLSFDAVGLPAFQFIQDPLDYGSRTHHSELDVYDHAEPGDLMQSSAIMASFVYNAATRPSLLPRKPLHEPLPAEPTSLQVP